MRIKLTVLLFSCTALITLNVFGQKGVSGKVPSHIPENLIWQCGNKADGYLESRTLYIVGEDTYSFYNPGNPSNFPDFLKTEADMVDSIIVNVKSIGKSFLCRPTAPWGSDITMGAPYSNKVKYIEITAQAIDGYNINLFGNVDFVKINEGVTFTGSSSFTNLPSLKKVYFPSTLNQIGQWFGYQCHNLRHVVLPRTVPPDATYFESSYLAELRPTLWIPYDIGAVTNTYYNTLQFNEPRWRDFDLFETRKMTEASIKTFYHTKNRNRDYELSPEYSPSEANTSPLVDWILYDYDPTLMHMEGQTLLFDTDSVEIFFGLELKPWEAGIGDRQEMHRTSDYAVTRKVTIESMNIMDPIVLVDSIHNKFNISVLPENQTTLDLVKLDWNRDIFNLNIPYDSVERINNLKWDKIQITTLVDTFGTWPITATSWEGLTAETTITVISTNNDLINLNLNVNDKITPVDLTTLRATVDEDIQQVTIQPTPRHNVSTYQIYYQDENGELHTTQDGIIPLHPSQFEIPVKIHVRSEHQVQTDPDGDSGQVYELLIVPDPSTDARAGSLNVILIDSNGIESPSQLVPEFHPDVYEYELISDIVIDYDPDSLLNNIKQVRLEGSNYHPRAYKPDSTQIDIYEGENKIVLRVQAQHPDHHSEYTVKIWRISPPRLSRLTVEDTDVPLLPGQYKYELQVPAHQARVRVQAEAVEADHHVAGTGFINLSYGLQQIPITVTGLRNMKQIYRLNITREGTGQTDLPAGLSAIEQDIHVDVFTLTGIYLGKHKISNLNRLKKYKVVIIKTSNNVIKVKL